MYDRSFGLHIKCESRVELSDTTLQIKGPIFKSTSQSDRCEVHELSVYTNT